MEPFFEDVIYEGAPGQEPRRTPVKEYVRYRGSDLADFSRRCRCWSSGGRLEYRQACFGP